MRRFRQARSGRQGVTRTYRRPGTMPRDCNGRSIDLRTNADTRLCGRIPQDPFDTGNWGDDGMKFGPWQLIRSVPGYEIAKGFVRNRLLSGLVRKRRFSAIYATNYWRNGESRSGLGSSLAQTEAVRAALPTLCRDLGISSMLDIPCGDLNWIRHVDLP